MTDPVAPKFLCFGEILWDQLPDARHIGGAPLNVAYHLSKLGSAVWPISSVGDDEAGRALLAELKSRGIATDFVKTISGKASGLVRVSLTDGSPSYEIVEDVAWDYIDVPDSLPRSCQPVSAIVFGSLAQRGEHNRDALQRLFAVERHAFRVFDVNLRPPFDEASVVWQLMLECNVVKMNFDEARQLIPRNAAFGDPESIARYIQRETGCGLVCITQGEIGAGMLDRGNWYWVDAFAVEVRDTVGAGDAFLAGLLHGLFSVPNESAAALSDAARLAAFVAGSDGAMPPYEIEQLS